MNELVSIVIRTLNEDFYLDELLTSIEKQNCDNFQKEVVIIDSGSTDNTIKIAKKHKTRITYIDKKNFTFGRSLNEGSDFARGNTLVYISGHCIPCNVDWLEKLVRPILDGDYDYTYGKQVGRDTTKFSERQIFRKYFPSISKIPQKDFFCNNANSALSKKCWQKYRFDENITGLEDMDLSKRLYEDNGRIAYISEAPVYHIHNETWKQTKRRYERESIAMQKIMPELQINFRDMIRYIFAAILSDSARAISEKVFINEFLSICKFRVAQFLGAFQGNHSHRALSKEKKEKYFYPTKKI